MKCEICGSVNDDNNKHCVHCGHEIKTDIVAKKSSKHIVNYDKDRHKINKHSIHSNTPNLKPLWIIGGVVIGSILIVILFDLIFNKYKKNEEFIVETKNSNPAIEAQVTAIASKFICSCQTNECAESTLETCTCVNAIEERQFIRDKLVQNNKPDDIVVALANKYGSLKPEFKSRYDVDPGKIWNSN